MASKHSVLSASAAKRWMSCPGSVRLCKLCPPAPESKYAREGTVAHGIAEIALRGTRDLWECIDDPDVTPEMLDHAHAYAAYVKGLRGPLGKLWTEKRIRLKAYDKRAFGTADAVVFSGEHLYVVDYKYGAGVAVDVIENPQLRFYALGALATLPEKFVECIETVSMTVFQPRADHDDGPIRRETLSIVDLLTWGQDVLKPAMERTKDKDALLASGEHCRWCPALAYCPEHGRMPPEIGGGDITRTPLRSLPKPRDLSPQQLGIALDARPVIEEWFKAIHALSLEQLEHGKTIPGYKLVVGRKSKYWTDEQGAEAAMKFAGISPYTASTLVSPAAAIKRGFDPTPFMAEKFGQPSIAAVASKRKEIAPSRTAANDFDDDDSEKEIDDGF